jgi:hypothetical protein
MQRLDQDTANVAKLREEVTRARATTVMVEAQAARVEKTSQESAALLASTR